MQDHCDAITVVSLIYALPIEVVNLGWDILPNDHIFNYV